MISAFKVFFRAVGDLWFNLIGYSACNVVASAGAVILPLAVYWIASALGVPWLFVFMTALTAFLVIGAPLLLSLVRLTSEALVYNERPEVGTLLQYARSEAHRAWQLTSIQVVGILIVLIVIYFYASLPVSWNVPFVLTGVVVGWIWMGMVLYSAPMLVRSERGVKTALRNSFIAFSRYPIYSTTLLALMGAVLLTNVFIPPMLVLVTLSYLAILVNRATNWVLQKEGLMPIPEEPED